MRPEDGLEIQEKRQLMKKREKTVKWCILGIVIIFALYMGVWLAYRHFRYGKFEKVTNGEEGVFVGDYLCATFVPSVLSFRGNLSISQRIPLNGETSEAKNISCDMLIFPKLFGGYEIYITLLDNGTNTLPDGVKSVRFRISEKMELLNAEEDVRSYYDEFYDSILSICRVAEETFGLFDMGVSVQ